MRAHPSMQQLPFDLLNNILRVSQEFQMAREQALAKKKEAGQNPKRKKADQKSDW